MSISPKDAFLKLSENVAAALPQGRLQSIEAGRVGIDAGAQDVPYWALAAK